MTSLGVSNSLSAVLVPIGMIGAALAVMCAIVAGIAVARGAAGLSGGAVGLWIPSAMLSVTASFANEWMPLWTSAAALVAMLVLGGTVRAIVSAAQTAEPPYPRAAAPASAAASLARPARTPDRSVGSAPTVTNTGTITLARTVRPI